LHSYISINEKGRYENTIELIGISNIAPWFFLCHLPLNFPPEADQPLAGGSRAFAFEKTPESVKTKYEWQMKYQKQTPMFN
jgi:hypothetical protein